MEVAYKHIMLVTNRTPSARATEQSAVNLAKKHDADILIVDTVRPPSLTSQWLTANSEELFEIVVQDKQQRLDELVAEVREHGVRARAEVLVGKSSQVIVNAVQAENIDLVVRYMKGEKSPIPGSFGTTARNLMRACPCPVLLVGDTPLENPRILACVNPEHEFDENNGIVQAATHMASDPLHLQFLYCWKFYGSEIMRDYMSEKIWQANLDEAETTYRMAFENMIDKLHLDSADRRVHLENGAPAEIIPQVCRHESIDVVVMSSASQNHPIKRLLGSTIESVLPDLPCALMVVKPTGFTSPVAPHDSSVETA
ncbi:MAG: universal stress protein [Pirellulaceae bacterium]